MDNLLFAPFSTGSTSMGQYYSICAIGIACIVAGLVLITLSIVQKTSVPASALQLRKRSRNQRSELSEKKPICRAASLMGDRKYQQDYTLYFDATSENVPPQGVLAVVCDGMGGMNGGEQASRLCAETLFHGFYQFGPTRDVCALLRSLVQEADQAVALLTTPDGKLLQGGTTVVAAVIRDSRAYWASAGDSRIYLFSKGQLHRLTRDHNYRLRLMEEYEAGRMTMEQVENEPQKEALISFVGKGSISLIDTGEIPYSAAEGDVLVLCSDGVYKTMSDNDILSVIQACGENKEEMALQIARTAVSRGNVKHDNTTALTISA